MGTCETLLEWGIGMSSRLQTQSGLCLAGYGQGAEQGGDAVVAG
jgi:hypothetical protein